MYPIDRLPNHRVFSVDLRYAKLKIGSRYQSYFGVVLIFDIDSLYVGKGGH